MATGDAQTVAVIAALFEATDRICAEIARSHGEDWDALPVAPPEQQIDRAVEYLRLGVHATETGAGA